MKQHRLVVLDGWTVNPGDLSWEPIQALVEKVEVHERTSPEECADRLRDATLVLSNKVRLGAREFDAAPDLRFIGVLATGYDVIDVGEAASRGIVVSNVPAYSTQSVVQWVWGAVLSLAHRLDHHAAEVRNGRWQRSPDFCFYDGPMIELAGKTLGIIGFGRIGQAVGRVAHALGMRVVVATRTPHNCEYAVEFLERAAVFAQADVVSLHCPLTSETRNMVDASLLAMMKRGAFLVNSGRGPLVVESDVAAALCSGHLGGYAADVVTSEPPCDGSPLISAPNCLVTPHIAWATIEARRRLLEITAENIAMFLAGKPSNQVNGKAAQGGNV